MHMLYGCIGIVLGIILIFLVIRGIFWWFDTTHLESMKEMLSEEDYKIYEKDYKDKGGIKGLSGH